MRSVLVLPLVVLVSAFQDDDPDSQLERDEVIKAVNDAKTTWKAGRNFPASYTQRQLKSLLGLKTVPGETLPPLVDDDEDDNLELPENFDARDKWSHCKALQEVRDQGPCGSCWAVGAVSAFTDRLCIATGGEFNGHLSVEDVLSCSYAGGCGGGGLFSAWLYFKDNGVCTGGDYKSEEGCQPYLIPPCEHHMAGPRNNCSLYPHPYPTPKCQENCYNKKYNKHTKDQDLYKTLNVFSMFGLLGLTKIQREIYKNGPVETGFTVYEDFLSYKSGVYQHIYGKPKGGHAVKVIGWGNENGTDYWLVANSWNSDWGDKGFFKIRRGTDECGFEGVMCGGYPDVSDVWN